MGEFMVKDKVFVEGLIAFITKKSYSNLEKRMLYTCEFDVEDREKFTYPYQGCYPLHKICKYNDQEVTEEAVRHLYAHGICIK